MSDTILFYTHPPPQQILTFLHLHLPVQIHVSTIYTKSSVMATLLPLSDQHYILGGGSVDPIHHHFILDGRKRCYSGGLILCEYQVEALG